MQAWATRCAGDVQAVAMRGKDKAVIGGHFSKVYDASNAAEGVTRTRIAQLDVADGTSAQGVMGPWDLLVDRGHLYVGGSFTLVHGLQRTQFARFTFAP